MAKRSTILAALLAFGLAIPAIAEDWSRFRGPGASGKAEAAGLPSTWDSKTNIVWKADLPGPGGSSPVVAGDRVFVTCYSGYAESIDNPGDMANLKRHIVCLDRSSGAILWSKEFAAKQPESEYRGSNNTRHGYASSTPATDGEKVYVFCGRSGVMALDMDGAVAWTADVGSDTHGWGSGTSPVLYKNLVIVNASIESQSLVAIDKNSGEIVWKTPGIKSCWSSPILADVGDKQEIVLNAPNRVMGFDPETGQELWQCEGVPDSYICPTAVAEDGIVYVIGGRKNTAIAVRAGGRGDVTGSRMLWKTSRGSNVSSPVLVDGHLYWFHESRGTVFCLDAKTGDVVFEEALAPKPGLVYSSATFADGKLYAVSQENGAYVVAAKPQFELIAVNRLQDDSSRVNASIAVSGNQLLMRTDKAIYCIGQ